MCFVPDADLLLRLTTNSKLFSFALNRILHGHELMAAHGFRVWQLDIDVLRTPAHFSLVAGLSVLDLVCCGFFIPVALVIFSHMSAGNAMSPPVVGAMLTAILAFTGVAGSELRVTATISEPQSVFYCCRFLKNFLCSRIALPLKIQKMAIATKKRDN